jgi:ubiquinone/menaquinone biosynthesis C-methylase UbiE
MEDYFETNRGLWNGWARINVGSEFYDLEGFKSGKTSLQEIELTELGEVSGKSLLHLQCHFGLDTMSWARMGARATGVDLSDEAISLARSISEELQIDARFINSNIYDLPAVLDERFDIVYTSYGTLCWLPDLKKWAELIWRYLKPGGTFYTVDFHPIINILDDEGDRIQRSYFYSAEPLSYEVQGSYADWQADFRHKAYEWQHPISDIVNALISVGLKLEFLHEFPFSPYCCDRFTKEIEPGRYELDKHPNSMPITYSIRAKR